MLQYIIGRAQARMNPTLTVNVTGHHFIPRCFKNSKSNSGNYLGHIAIKDLAHNNPF